VTGDKTGAAPTRLMTQAERDKPGRRQRSGLLALSMLPLRLHGYLPPPDYLAAPAGAGRHRD
jgi:hypothetical protein